MSQQRMRNSRPVTLHLLRAPSRVRIPHVLRRLDGWYILEHNIGNTSYGNDRSRDIA